LRNAILKEEIEEQNLFQPQITRKSISMLKNKDHSSSQAQMRRERRVQEYINEKKKQEESYFVPKISKKAQNMKRGLDPLI